MTVAPPQQADADRARLIAPGEPPAGAWEIVSRHRVDPTGFASPADFTLGVEARLAEGSVYTLDPFTGAVHLVDVPYSALAGEPFAYATQAEGATVLATRPYSGLMAATRPVTGLFSIGRCGSTLLARILRAAEAQVLSELDAFTTLGHVSRRWPSDAVVQAKLTAMAHGVLGHIARGTPAGPLVLKFRSQAMQAAQAICEAGVRPVLLTRGFDDWARSTARHFPDDPVEGRIDALQRGIEDMAALPERPVILDYDRLLADPVAAAEACIGPIQRDRHDAIRACLNDHSQRGTALAKPQASVSDDDIQRARDLWARQANPRSLQRLGLDHDLTLLTERA